MKTKKTNRERIEIRQTHLAIPTADGRRVAERVAIEVPMRWDPELEKWLLTHEAIERLETAKARHMGLMLPGQLLALRQRLGLSQREIGDLLRIGAKSWTRWESGAQRPSQSINLLLQLLDTGVISPRQLLHVGDAQADWSRQFFNLTHGNRAGVPVALDQLRSNDSTEWVEPHAIPA